MNKVMLIMDNPNACIECPLCFKAEEMSLGNFEYKRLYSCKKLLDGVEDVYLEDILHKKPDWCPLKEIPKKMEVCGKYPQPDGIVPSYKIGFNACIDEILKESG